jgi:large subunit ribosomal protein L29
MELKELKKKTKAELQKMLIDSRDKLREMKFKDANRQLKNIREIRKLKREIARILTLLNQEKKA